MRIPRPLRTAGAPTDGDRAQPHAAAGPDGDADARTRRLRRGRALVVAAVVLALVAAVAVVIGLRGGVDAPAAAVVRYAERIAAGDATGANELVDPGGDEASRLLLTDEVLASSTTPMSRLDARTVGEPVTAADGTTVAHVQLTYALGTTGATVTLRVSQDAAAPGGWQVLDPLTATTRVRSQEAATTEVGGVAVHIGDPAVTASAVAPWSDLVTYPGTYALAPAETPYVTSDEQTFVAVAGTTASPRSTGASVDLGSSTTPELFTAIDEAVVVALDACIAGSPVEGVTCLGFPSDPAAVLWRADPVVLSAAGGEVRTSYGGIQHLRPDGTIDTDNIAFDGTYAFDEAGGVVLRGRIS